MGVFKRHTLQNRFCQSVLSIIGAAVLIWSILPLAPGDPSRRILQARGIIEPTDFEINEMRRELKMDQPVIIRFLSWSANIAKGNFGISWQTGKPITSEFLKRLPQTLKLAITAFFLAALFAIPAGLFSAYYHNRWPDHLFRIFALIGAASPSFIISLFLIHFVIIGMGWGQVVLSGHWNQVWLPAFVLAIDITAIWSRLLRASLLEIKGRPFITSAMARGASEKRVLWFHAFLNALVPLLNMMGLTLGSLLGGTIIVETIFSWPGLGRYIIEAITARDLPVIQAYALFSTLCYVSVSLLVDIISSLLDPRIAQRWV